MSKGNILVSLCNKLSELQEEEIKETESGQKCEEHDISANTVYFCRLLQKLCGNSTHIVLPQFPLERFSTNENIWQHYIEKIRELKALHEGEIVKPVVAIWNKEEFLNSLEYGNVRATNWDTIVIIAKRYTTLSGLSHQNQSELIFLKTSENDDYLAGHIESCF